MSTKREWSVWWIDCLPGRAFVSGHYQPKRERHRRHKLSRDWGKRMRLQWRHNGRDGVSNHQPHDCLLNRLFRRRSKKYQSSASLASVRGIHRGPVNSPHKWPVTRKMFPFDDVIMDRGYSCPVPWAYAQGTGHDYPLSYDAHSTRTTNPVLHL